MTRYELFRVARNELTAVSDVSDMSDVAVVAAVVVVKGAFVLIGLVVFAFKSSACLFFTA